MPATIFWSGKSMRKRRVSRGYLQMMIMLRLV